MRYIEPGHDKIPTGILIEGEENQWIQLSLPTFPVQGDVIATAPCCLKVVSSKLITKGAIHAFAVCRTIEVPETVGEASR